MINIEIFKGKDKKTNLVNARDLHEFLEVGRDFSNWFKARVKKYEFIENSDYIVFAKTGEPDTEVVINGRPKTEYGITLSMAKELSMVENNDKGKTARKYFIQAEKDAVALAETLKHGIDNDLKAIDSIESKYADKINAGKHKVIKSFLREVIGVKGVSEVGNSVITVKNDLKKDKKEWFLKHVGITFKAIIEESKGSWILQNATALEASKAVIASQYGEFSRRSASQNARHINKDYKMLRTAKDAVTNAFLSARPKVYTGALTVGVDDETGGRFYEADDEYVSFAVSPTTANKDGKVINFISGTILFKEDNAFINVHGGQDATIVQSKTRSLDKEEYNAVIEFNLARHTYTTRLLTTKF